MKEEYKKIISLIETLQQRRYPTLLIIKDKDVDYDALLEIAGSCSLHFIDYFHDIINIPNSPVILGAYLRGQFREWLKEKAKEYGGIFVVHVDELISTWEEIERKAFFMDFLRIESNALYDSTRKLPIVMISKHANKFQFKMADLGQGIILKLSSNEQEEP